MAEKKRRTPLRSAFAGQSPVNTDPTENLPVEPAAPTPAKAPEAPAKKEAPKKVTSPASKAGNAGNDSKAPAEEDDVPVIPPKRNVKKVTFYQDVDDEVAMRAAYVSTIATDDGVSTISEFIASAITEKVDRLAKKHNNGEPFPTKNAAKVPKGAPRR